MNDRESDEMERRRFLSMTTRAGLAAAIFPSVTAFPDVFANKTFTAGQIVDLIQKEVPRPLPEKTVDGFKSGSASQTISGIVTTMFATVAVAKKAIALGANMIIAHEPTFFNGYDDLNWVPGNSQVRAKQEFLKSSGIAVWRFHDGWHAMVPDGILSGFVKKAGWEPYCDGKNPSFTMPASRLGDIAGHLKKSLDIPHVRIIGDPDASCSKICLLPGAWGGERQVSLSESEKPDLLIVGEVVEWETVEYIRDGLALGNKTKLIVLGHAFSEEPGMEYLAAWLTTRIPGLPVHHVPAGEAFTWL